MYAFLLGDRSLMSNNAPSGPTRLGCRRCPPPRFWPGVLVTRGREEGGEGEGEGEGREVSMSKTRTITKRKS